MKNIDKHIVSPQSYVSLEMRHQKNGHKGGVFWFTGLSGAGKSTIAHGVEKNLFHQGVLVNVLDGDNVRGGLCSDLSFSFEGRAENIRRIAEVAKIMALQGGVCLCSFITPLKAHRDIARQVLQNLFYEIYVSCPLKECECRDVKGFYKLAREGKIKNYTGISDPYEVPSSCDLIVETNHSSEEECIDRVEKFIFNKIKNRK